MLHKSYKLFPLESEENIDCYDNIIGDYCDQFNLPFLEDFADFLDTNPNQTIHFNVSNEDGSFYEGSTISGRDNYLGLPFDEQFSELLWNHRGRELTVEVTV